MGGLTSGENLSALKGGLSTGNCSEWAPGTSPTYKLHGPPECSSSGRVSSSKELVEDGGQIRYTCGNPGNGCSVLVAFHRSRKEVRVALGEQRAKIHVPEGMWPAADQNLFPFFVIDEEDICGGSGFQEMSADEGDLPLLVEALSEDVARERAPDFFNPVVSASDSGTARGYSV